MQSDVIVVGAGPAGSTAAYDLARQGISVTLLEQKELPRYKPCGGCLSLKIDTILEPDFHDFVERTIHGARFTFEGLDEIRVRSERPVAYMVMRDRFDHFLARKAQRAGVELRTGQRVVDVAETGDGVRVTTRQRQYTARYLLGADGANGVVGRALRLTPRRRVAVCVEAEVTTGPQAPVMASDEVRIEFGGIPFGYGWVFPKGDHLSVGVGGLRGKLRNPRAIYDEFLIDQDLADALVSESRKGYIIPVFAGGRDPITSARTVLLGDAAALVDPFLGEGIYYAIRSGQLAAQVLGDAVRQGSVSAPAAYQSLVESEIYHEFQSARYIAVFLYLFPRAGYAMLKRLRLGFTDTYFDVLRGEAGYGDLWRTLRRGAAGELARTFQPVTRERRSVAQHYDRLAKRYDEALPVWRSLVAGPTWEAVGDLLAKYVPPGGSVLDAGTGTGAAVRLVLERANPGRVTAVDISKGMLRAGRKGMADRRVSWEQQDVTALPYAECSFDVVVSTWVLETLIDPRAAVTEFLRVLKEDGTAIYVFSSRPEAGVGRRWYGRLLEEWSAGTLRGRFIATTERPYHTCQHSQLVTFAGGLATLVVLGKCCRVDDPAAACLPARRRSGSGSVERELGMERRADARAAEDGSSRHDRGAPDIAPP